MRQATRVIRFLVLAELVFIWAFLGAPAQETENSTAVEIANRTMEAMGGRDAFNNARYVRFDFKVGKDGEWRVDRSHLWDKWTGRYRYERALEDGKLAVALFNVNDKNGDFYLDGEKIEGDTADEALERAYGGFINDSYWLAMPWKWLDPGVRLKYIGEEERNGESCDVVELSFDSVGLTPGDVYRAYVSRKSNLMVHWSYKLQSDRTGAWDWEYVDAGGVMLAKTHRDPEGIEINMGAVATAAEMDEGYFTDPAKTIR